MLAQYSTDQKISLFARVQQSSEWVPRLYRRGSLHQFLTKAWLPTCCKTKSCYKGFILKRRNYFCVFGINFESYSKTLS